MRFEETSSPSFFVSSSLSSLNEGECDEGCEVLQLSGKNVAHWNTFDTGAKVNTNQLDVWD